LVVSTKVVNGRARCGTAVVEIEIAYAAVALMTGEELVYKIAPEMGVEQHWQAMKPASTFAIHCSEWRRLKRRMRTTPNQ
jgi:hypothetical protein